MDQAVGDPSGAPRLPVLRPPSPSSRDANRQVIVIDDEGSPSQKLDKGKGRAEADPVDPSPIAGPAPPRQPIPDSFDLILGLARLNLQPVPEPRPAAAPFALPDTAVVPPPNALNPLEFNFGPAAAVFGAPPAGLPPPVVNPAPAPPIANAPTPAQLRVNFNFGHVALPPLAANATPPPPRAPENPTPVAHRVDFGPVALPPVTPATRVYGRARPLTRLGRHPTPLPSPPRSRSRHSSPSRLRHPHPSHTYGRFCPFCEADLSELAPLARRDHLWACEEGWEGEEGDLSGEFIPDCFICGEDLREMESEEREAHIKRCVEAGVVPEDRIVFVLTAEGLQQLKEIAEANGENPECPSCYEDFETDDTLARLGCYCLYHAKCFDEWLAGPLGQRKFCPVHSERRDA